MGKRKRPEYFVTYENSDKCFIVVPAEVATRLADYIDEKWSNEIIVDEIDFRNCFYAMGWESYERVGILRVLQNGNFVNGMHLGAVSTMVVSSFYAYCVNSD